MIDIVKGKEKEIVPKGKKNWDGKGEKKGGNSRYRHRRLCIHRTDNYTNCTNGY